MNGLRGLRLIQDERTFGGGGRSVNPVGELLGLLLVPARGGNVLLAELALGILEDLDALIDAVARGLALHDLLMKKGEKLSARTLRRPIHSQVSLPIESFRPGQMV